MVFVNAAGYKWQSLTTPLRQDPEAQLLKVVGKIIRDTCQVAHDTSVAPLSEADHLVVLANNLGRATREIEREGRLVSTEVVDVENELFWQELRVTPYDPPNTGVYETVFVA